MATTCARRPRSPMPSSACRAGRRASRVTRRRRCAGRSSAGAKRNRSKQGNMRWVPGPPGIERPQAMPGRADVDQPAGSCEPTMGRSTCAALPRRPIRRRNRPSVAEQTYPPAQQANPADRPPMRAIDIPDDAVLPPGRSAAAGFLCAARRAPITRRSISRRRQQRAPPPLGPMRGPNRPPR